MAIVKDFKMTVPRGLAHEASITIGGIDLMTVGIVSVRTELRGDSFPLVKVEMEAMGATEILFDQAELTVCGHRIPDDTAFALYENLKLRFEPRAGSAATPPRPWPPHNRLLLESGGCGTCPVCGSSLKRRLPFIGAKRCIHPECSYTS